MSKERKTGCHKEEIAAPERTNLIVMEKMITFTAICVFDDAQEDENDALMSFVNEIKEMRTGEMIENMRVEDIRKE